MTKIFVQNTIPTKELLSVIQQITAAGYDNHQAFIGANFAEFAAPLQKGDTAVVYSLATFGSVNEIIATVEHLATRGIELQSIQEPWIQDPKISAKKLLAKLFELGERLHQPAAKHPRTSRRATPRNPTQQPIAERVAAAVELVTQKQIPITKACRTAGCSVSAYYTYKGTTDPS